MDICFWLQISIKLFFCDYLNDKVMNNTLRKKSGVEGVGQKFCHTSDMIDVTFLAR